MKKIAIGMLACLAAWQVSAAQVEWLTDLSKAQAKAKSENKLVFVEFTGSDWCPPCKALHKNVLTDKAFEAYAKDNLILVEVDFPQAKPQSKDLKEANAALSKKYKVEGFPTVIVLSADGKELKREVGYSGESAEKFVETLKKLKT